MSSAAAAAVADAFIFHWVHSPFRPQCPLHYLLFIRLCRRDALRSSACPTPLSYPSSRASLTRSCVTFIGHVVALWPFGIAARTAAAAEWSLVCLFVCFAVRPSSPSPFPTQQSPSNHPSIHFHSTTSSFFPISFSSAFCQTF